MLSVGDVGIVARREIMRNLRSTKGIAMFALFFLAGFLPAVLRLALRQSTGDVSDEEVRAGFELFLTRMAHHPAEVARHIAPAGVTLYTLFQGTLTFLPLVVLLIGFDQIAGEVQHRTIRYSVGRASRPSIVVGKALGIWGVAAVMITVVHATVWILAAIQGGGSVIAWGPRLLLFSVIGAGAYVGFASLVSSLFRTPIVALLVGSGAGFAIWLLNKLLGAFPSTERITWAFPNRYEDLLFEPAADRVVLGLSLFLLWGAACVVLSSLLVSRRDV
jgi:ABC-type transport system involved in multi-copper enzyme maturation permease subunit